MVEQAKREERRPRVFATADIGTEALDRLRRQGYTVEVYEESAPPSHELILEKVRSGIDALITTLRDSIDEEILAAGKGRLRVVAQDGAGFDNIDRAAANRYAIPFTNTADVLSEATAEFAFFMLGDVARKLYPAERLVDEGCWPIWHPSLPFLGDEVTGKCVAVIGLGRVGRAFIKKCLGFDMDILCHHPAEKNGEIETFLSAVRQVARARVRSGLCRRHQRIELLSLRGALKEADFVSLHVPLLRQNESLHPTYHLIGAEQLRWMKATAYLINTSRGPVIDEAALAEALIANEIAGAALDVFEQEPLPATSPLRDHRLHLRVRKYPHFASAARATRLDPDPEVGMAGRCVQAVIEVLESNGDLSNSPYLVNREAFPTEDESKRSDSIR